MSVRQTQSGDLLASYPDFGLSCLYDDDENPSEVTVFPGEEMSTTEWVTADVDSAVSLDELR
ncbi:hypothetical protein B4589_004745 [Halolamina sp. CBA1230]|uniref:DUF7511 domain-containing protein n=1 Tax=Halolamina sp. CBA1230 TaxID=1853690 RepID=UPI0009A17DC5|nr:hypothetical protein [Halolamina sp. CBA1230]QKY19721.1 hypothetical protein B4589_004745 [Halolamina sp. CBA1230]